MSNPRVEKIIHTMDENGITAYEIAKHTSLSNFAIHKIKTGESKNPQRKTLDEIEEYLNSRLSIASEDRADYNTNETPFYNKDGSPVTKKQISEHVVRKVEIYKEDIVFKNMIDKEALMILLRAKKGDTIDIDLIGK